MYVSQFTLVDDIFGEIELFEPHTIILDRTHCPTHNFTIVPPPPPPTPLPPLAEDASPTCRGFHEAFMRDNFSEPLECRHLEGGCDSGISCDLLILTTRYEISVEYVSAMSGFEFRVAHAGGGAVLGLGSGSEVNVSLPYPEGARLIFTQRLVSENIRGFQVRMLRL